MVAGAAQASEPIVAVLDGEVRGAIQRWNLGLTGATRMSQAGVDVRTVQATGG